MREPSQQGNDGAEIRRSFAAIKSPFRGETEGAAEELGQLEFVNQVGKEHELVFESAIAPNTSAANRAVPAQLKTAENVFPEVVLHCSSEFDRFFRERRQKHELTPLANVFGSSVNAKLLGRLICAIGADAPDFAAAVVNFDVVKSGTEFEAGDGRIHRAADIDMSFIGAELRCSRIKQRLIETVDDAGA